MLPHYAPRHGPDVPDACRGGGVIVPSRATEVATRLRWVDLHGPDRLVVSGECAAGSL
jgi:hypothetical protein